MTLVYVLFVYIYRSECLFILVDFIVIFLIFREKIWSGFYIIEFFWGVFRMNLVGGLIMF